MVRWRFLHLAAFSMHILYVDMSGNLNNPNDRHFVMAGVAVRENAIYHVIRELDEIVASSELGIPPDAELHGVEILRGKKVWRKVSPEDRITFFKRCLGVFQGPSSANLRAFGIIIDKGAQGESEPGEYCYEQMCSRFNLYLQRLYNRASGRHKYKHRGLIVVDDSKYKGLFESLAADFRVNGTRWGRLPNLAEIPFFAPSHASRLIQLADLVSYSLWQRYERGDRRYVAAMAGAFDYDAGRTHGIHHLTNGNTGCDCPSCLEKYGLPLEPQD